MTTAHQSPDDSSGIDYPETARRHLWRHFADMSDADRNGLKVIARGEGSYLIDTEGRRYLDAVSNLFCVNVGYSFGAEIGKAALEQFEALPYHSNWGTTHPRAIELAEKLASLAPGDLNHVFLTPSGGEAVETAWKIARQYFKLRGENRWKAIARDEAYHGTSMGALSLIGIPPSRTPFEPLVPGVARARCTRGVDRPENETEAAFTAFLLDDLEQQLVNEDPSTVAMILLEPVQNHGGCLVAPPGYMAGVRAIADKYGILVVADETITAFGRLGHWFGSERVGLEPDIITTAKGLSSAHGVIAAVIASERVYEPFTSAGASFKHGNTFGGHPVMSAIALKNIEIIERLDLNSRVRSLEPSLVKVLQGIVDDFDVAVEQRGAGFFRAIELATHLPDGRLLTAQDRSALYGPDAIARPLEGHGVLTRVSLDGVCPVICVSPPLIAGEAEFHHLETAIRAVLSTVDRARKNY